MKAMPSHFFGMPHTRLGWWSVGLAVAFVVVFIIYAMVFIPTSSDAPWRPTTLPNYGILIMLCGLGAGIVGLIAVIRQHERSWLIWLSLLPGLLALFALLGDFLSAIRMR